MSTSNGQRHRLRRLEDDRPPGPSADEEEEAKQWRDAWNSAAWDLISTMALVHVEALVRDIGWHEQPEPGSPWGRVRGEFMWRIIQKVGRAPGEAPRWPDSPLALPPAVVEAILANEPNLRTDGRRCVACGYRMPIAGEHVAIAYSEDGWHDLDTGEPCSAPYMPDITTDRGRWRTITLFSACPLCGCEALTSTVNDKPAQPVV